MKKVLFLLGILTLGALSGSSAIDRSNLISKSDDLEKGKEISNCRPRITVEHFDCDGSGEASIVASFKHLSIKNCGGPFDFYWKKKESEITPKPLADLFVSEYTVTEPGTYNLIIQDGIEILFDIDIDVGYKYDWEASESAISPEFDLSGYNTIEYTPVAIPDGGGIYYVNGKGQGTRLPIAQTGWFEFDVENSDGAPKSVGLNWSNLEEFSNVKLAIGVTGTELEYTATIIGISSTMETIPLDDLDGFKIKRTTDGYEVYINAYDQYTLIHEGALTSHALNAFLKIKGLKVVNTCCSYPCSEKELTLFAPMRRDIDGELHLMSTNEIRVIYNEPYETTAIQKLELVKNNEIIDVTDLIPLNDLDLPDIKRGDNRWIIPVSDLGFADSEVALIRLTNIKGEIYYLRIMFQDTD